MNSSVHPRNSQTILEQIQARENDPQRELVLRGGHVLTMEGASESFIGDVHIVGDQIVGIGPESALNVSSAAVVVDVSGSAVLPGLVDSHVHAWEGQFRGIAPEADFGAYMALAHGVLAPLMSPEDVAIGQRISVAQALNGGVTTIVDNSHNSRSRDHSNAAVEALQDTGIRAVHAAGAAQAGEHDNQLPGDLLRLRDTYFPSSDQLTTLRLMELAPTIESWRFAAENDFGVCVEMGAWIPELDALLQSGLMGERHTFNHCTGLSPEQWKMIADAGSAINLVPRSDSYFGLGSFVPVLEANRHGIQEGISTDNELSYGSDMFTEMRTLLTVQRALTFAAQADGETDIPARYGPQDVLRAATVGGAQCAGLADSIGTLEVGKKADLVVLDLDTVPTRPFGPLVGTVVNFAGVGNVDTVIVGGKVKKFGGHLVGIDYGKLVAEAEASRDRLLGSA